ncbi:MAG: hypothetical protein EBZ59_01960, partial [Planctomycetia bacterium]|nr:hypothetical protein [Planctomycetia bacterium]
MNPEKTPIDDEDDAPRLHHDVLGDRTVFIAPRRAGRPSDLDPAGGGTAAACPFCAGNESMTPGESLRLPETKAEPWRIRIIPNHFPAVEDRPPGACGEWSGGGPRPAHGVHEVVIESPRHERSILGVDPSSWRDAWELSRRRLEALSNRDDLAWGTVFKNSGAAAGASMEHLHSQLIAIDFVPPVVLAELAAATRANDPFGELLRDARADGRVVAEAGDVVAVVPPAPRQA